MITTKRAIFQIHIEPSTHTKNKRKKDICDKLAGDYPKDFVFEGWHPQCFCIATPIMPSDEEMIAEAEARRRGEKYVYKQKPITDYPSNFKRWVGENAGKIMQSRANGTEPYFLAHNKAAVDNIIDPKEAPRITPKNAPKAVQTPAPKEMTMEERRQRALDTYNSQGDKELPKVSQNVYYAPNETVDEEVKKSLMDFAAKNPDLFLGGLNDVIIVKDPNSGFFMSSSRSLNNENKYDIQSGNTIRITDRDFVIDDKGNVFNPFKELKGALCCIANKTELSFNQEYALECAWHEIQHCSAVGWQCSIEGMTNLKLQAMETINQFCSRHSYADFVSNLGGSVTHQAEVIDKGYGYGDFVPNFQVLMHKCNITAKQAYDHFKDLVTKAPYEDLYDEIVTFIKANDNYTTNIEQLVGDMLKLKRETFAKTLK